MFNGFEELMNEFQGYITKVEEPVEILEVGAKSFVNDLKKLPRPISKIRKTGYTHLIDTFAYKKLSKENEVGWGKYYGRMVENGTKKMTARPHLNPCFERNKDKYYRQMYMKIFDK